MDREQTVELFEKRREELLREIGAASLAEALAAGEFSDEEAEAEGERIVDGLAPNPKKRICEHPAVQAYIANPTVELGCDVLGVVGDIAIHLVLAVPPVTLTIAFIRFGLRRYCQHAGRQP